MSVRRTWKITKLASIKALTPSLRKEIIEDIVRHHPKIINLYAWDVNENIADSAFFSAKSTLGDWLRQKGAKLKFENKDVPQKLVLHEWSIKATDIIRYIHEQQIRNIPVPLNHIQFDIDIPSYIFEDILQTLKNQR
jgi:hypothetical protein